MYTTNCDFLCNFILSRKFQWFAHSQRVQNKTKTKLAFVVFGDLLFLKIVDFSPYCGDYSLFFFHNYPFFIQQNWSLTSLLFLIFIDNKTIQNYTLQIFSKTGGFNRILHTQKLIFFTYSKKNSAKTVHCFFFSNVRCPL